MSVTSDNHTVTSRIVSDLKIIMNDPQPGRGGDGRRGTQLDAQGAADNIAELLRNKALHEDASRRIAEEYVQFKQIDVVEKRLQLIHDLEEGIIPERQAPLREDMRRILDEINRFSTNTVRPRRKALERFGKVLEL